MTKTFPKEELFVITAQIRRAAISIPSNISEGMRRKTDKEFAHFLHIAFGSGAELETQIKLCERLALNKTYNYSRIKLLVVEVMKMINALIRKLSIE